MRKWMIACSMAMLALGFAATSHADEWNKLTYLTFSGPVTMPGITLPAGSYRFELADPDSSRRVIRVSDKDGSKVYGTFLSISDQKLEPSDQPLVMFKETPSGSPQAVLAWFYPGETYGYEFVYPHDQALKIAKATHRSVLAMKDAARSSTDEERMASMKRAQVGRIDENDKPVTTDEQLKDSSSLHPSNTAAPPATTTARSTTARTSAAANTAQPSTAEPANPQSNAQSTTASANAERSTTARSSTTNDRAVGTSGSSAQANAATDTASKSPRRRLPGTASELPLMELLSGLAFAGGAGVRALRRR